MASVEPGRDEVDDRLGETEARRDLDGAGDRDDVDRDALVGEEASCGVRVGGRDAQAGQVRRSSRYGAVGRDGGGEPAAAVAEVADPGQLGAGLGQQVDAGDPEVGHAVADELDDVVGPDEQDVEREVLDACDEAAVVLLEDEPRVVEQRERRLDEAALVGDRERGGGGRSSGAQRSPATG